MKATDDVPVIDGDPATRIFALVFLTVLTIVTAGVIAAIVAGNISHYRYHPAHPISNLTSNVFWNFSRSSAKSARLWLAREDQVSMVKPEQKQMSYRVVTLDLKPKRR